MEALFQQYSPVALDKVTVWFKACQEHDIPENGGACVKYKNKQIALYHFKRKQKWYACQNLCPHKMEMVLSRGMIGDSEGIAKVACPMHKKTFSLETGENQKKFPMMPQTGKRLSRSCAVKLRGFLKV